MVKEWEKKKKKGGGVGHSTKTPNPSRRKRYLCYMNTEKNYKSFQGCLENKTLKNIFKGINMWKPPIFPACFYTWNFRKGKSFSRIKRSESLFDP